MQNPPCGSHRLLKMLVLAPPHLEPAHPAGVWTGKRFRKCCRGFPVSTCGFPNSCSSSWCWPHLWVCKVPATILLLFWKENSASFSKKSAQLPLNSLPHPQCLEELAGTEGFEVVCAVSRHCPSLGNVSECPSCGSAGAKGQAGQQRGHSPGSITGGGG